MVRWEPDARGRLEQAAEQLFTERGFEQTTAAQIAERAGLSERTFFRHFADKREMLFGKSGELQQLFVDAVAGAPSDATPFEAVAVALEASAAVFTDIERSRARQIIIDSDASLQERELIKMARLGAAVAEVLRQRGVPTATASLAAQTGIAVFHVTFARWVEPTNRRGFAELLGASLGELPRLVGQQGENGARKP